VQDLKKIVCLEFVNSRQTYGKRRIRQAIVQQVKVFGPECVAKLMMEEKLVPKRFKKFKQNNDSSYHYSVATNRQENGFKVTEPNKVCSTDFTYIRTDEG
jgi:transposase InsO family protein